MLFDYAVKMSAGGLSPRVKWQNLKDFVVDLPDMEKQEELAEILWSMEYTKRAYRNMIAQTDDRIIVFVSAARFFSFEGNIAKFIFMHRHYPP